MESKSDPTIRFAIRTPDGIQTFKFEGGEVSEDNLSAHGTLFRYSKDGTIMAIVEEGGVAIYDTISGEKKSFIERPEVGAISLSPKNSYLLTWSRYRRVGESKKTPENLEIWNVATGERIQGYVQKEFHQKTWPTIVWAEDESIAARMKVGHALHFFEGTNFIKQSHIQTVPGIRGFSIGPDSKTFATFTPEKKGAPAFVKIQKYPSPKVVAQKSFFAAEEVEFLWNKTGEYVLLYVRTSVDRSHQSYSGKTSMYFLSASGKVDTSVPLDSTGPVHECRWSPNGSFFSVVYGFMPAKISVFDTGCTKRGHYGSAGRNTLRWSPCSRMLVVGGFGNLNGQVDIWNAANVEKVGSCVARSSSMLEWSPDARHFATAILSPKMRVDNGYTIFNYNGEKVISKAFPSLYQFEWQPSQTLSCKFRIVAKAGSSAPAKKSAAYVAPGLRRTGGGGPPSRGERSTGDGPKKYSRVSQTTHNEPVGYVPSKKGRRRRKKGKSEEKSDNNGGKGSSPVPEKPDINSLPMDVVPKRVKALKKKLRQIEALKTKQAGGETLDTAQITKIGQEEEIKEDIKLLEARLS